MLKFKPYKDQIYKIIGASMYVHKYLGHGLLEGIYEDALSIELKNMGIENETQKGLELFYKGIKLKRIYHMDIVVGDIVCELKSASEISPGHRAQLCNYLRLTKKPIGLLINFGRPQLQGERWAYDEETNECYLLDVNMNKLDMSSIYLECEP